MIGDWNKNYPHCKVEDMFLVGDGVCNKEGNTIECGWDGFDCLSFNAKFSNCSASEPFRVGDGYCNFALNTSDCGWDGGDCIGIKNKKKSDYPYCDVTNPEFLGDGKCDSISYNNRECGWDDGDCG